jgi:endoglucanase
MRGARVVSATSHPDAAIVIDAGFGISENSGEGFELGCGAILSVGPNLHPKLTNLIKECAQDAKIDVEIDVDGGNTGTDAWEIQVSGIGVPTALISFPVRYMHSTYEVIDVNDIENIARLIALTALKFKGGDTLCF